MPLGYIVQECFGPSFWPKGRLFCKFPNPQFPMLTQNSSVKYGVSWGTGCVCEIATLFLHLPHNHWWWNNIQLSVEQRRFTASCTLGFSFWEWVLISLWHHRASFTAALLSFPDIKIKTGRARDVVTRCSVRLTNVSNINCNHYGLKMDYNVNIYKKSLVNALNQNKKY